MAQHQHGHLTESQVNMICKTYDNEVMQKFTKDSEGKWYNERLEIEIIKRKEYSKSRSNNRKSEGKDKKHMKNTSKTYEEHMENRDEDINKEKKESKVIPSIEEFIENAKVVCKSNNIVFSEYEFAIKSKYQTWLDNGWKDGFNKPIKNWKNKFNNTLPNLKPIKNTAPVTNQQPGNLRPLLNQPKP